MSMDPEIVQLVSREVYRRFPELQGKKPRVRPYRPTKSEPATVEPGYLLTFSTQLTALPERKFSFSVRVVADDRGKILRITTSR